MKGGHVFRNGLTVVKFGSSVLRREEDLPVVVQEIARWRKNEQYVLAVVSALGNTTEELFERARSYGHGRHGDGTNEEAVARLVATGEEASAALLTLALARAGMRAKLLGPEQIQLIAEGAALDAKLSGVSAERIWSAFTDSEVVVVPGFIARTVRGSTVLLGRGGSDLTAVFLAHHLHASRCRLVKDVDGLYSRDPKSTDGVSSERFESLGWEEALGLHGRVVQVKALEFARENRLRFEVAGIGREHGTIVGGKME
jgi:homoserine dehydrogenase